MKMIQMLKKEKKAQAAMEFLMTYGWAILIILVILGVLFYLGIFSPKTSNTCLAVAPLTCTDVKADSTNNRIEISMGANGVDSADIAAVTINQPQVSGCTSPNQGCGAGTPTTDDICVSTSAIDVRYIGGCTAGKLVKGAKFSGSLPITYKLQGSAISHSTTVTFSGTVE